MKSNRENYWFTANLTVRDDLLLHASARIHVHRILFHAVGAAEAFDLRCAHKLFLIKLLSAAIGDPRFPVAARVASKVCLN